MLPPARATSPALRIARLRGPAGPWALALSLAGVALGCGAAPGATANAAPSPADARPHGYAVLARAASLDAAWPLAQEVYASDRLRPALSEAEARIFAGAPAPPRSGGRELALADLADTREAITDDGPTARRLLASLAKEYGLEGVFVVYPGAAGERPLVKAFIAGGAPRFAPVELRAEAGERPWASARPSLERLVPAAAQGPAAARPAVARGGAPKTEGHGAFYQSPWFWGAAGAAVVLGGAFFLATRDSSSDSIHLEMQVPR